MPCFSDGLSIARLGSAVIRLAASGLTHSRLLVHNWSNKRDVGRFTGRPWRRLREAVLVRDKYLCQPCLRSGRYTEAQEVDHIIPLAKGGNSEPSQLQSICVACHKQKTQVDSGNGKKIAIGSDGFPVSARIAARKPGGHWER